MEAKMKLIKLAKSKMLAADNRQCLRDQKSRPVAVATTPWPLAAIDALTRGDDDVVRPSLLQAWASTRQAIAHRGAAPAAAGVIK